MSGQGDNSLSVVAVQQLDDLARHFPGFMPRHAHMDFTVSAERSEVDLIAPEFGNAPVKERANVSVVSGHPDSPQSVALRASALGLTEVLTAPVGFVPTATPSFTIGEAS